MDGEDRSDREVSVPPGQPIPRTIWRAGGLWTTCRQECQNAFSIFPSHPVQDCSFWQRAYSKCWFHCPASVSSPASTPSCVALYEVYVRKKTQCYSQELSINEFIFIFYQWEELHDGQNQKQALLPPTTEQNSNNQEKEGYLIHVVQPEKPIYPFPSPHALNRLKL